MSTCNRLALETLKFKPNMSKKNSRHGIKSCTMESILLDNPKTLQIWGLNYNVDTADFFFVKCGLWLSRFQHTKPLNLVMCVGERDGWMILGFALDNQREESRWWGPSTDSSSLSDTRIRLVHGHDHLGIMVDIACSWMKTCDEFW